MSDLCSAEQLSESQQGGIWDLNPTSCMPYFGCQKCLGMKWPDNLPKWVVFAIVFKTSSVNLLVGVQAKPYEPLNSTTSWCFMGLSKSEWII